MIDLDRMKQFARDYAERLAAEPHWIAPHVVRVDPEHCEHQYLTEDMDACPSCSMAIIHGVSWAGGGPAHDRASHEEG